MRRFPFQTIFASAFVALLGSAGCSGGSSTPSAPAPPSPPPALPQISLAAVANGFALPVHVTHAGDGSGRIFVVEQAGRIREEKTTAGTSRKGRAATTAPRAMPRA